MKLSVLQGDIVEQCVDAIVTAANSGLRGGSGVDGAVHRAAGPRLLEAARALAPCPAGRAVVTPAFDLTTARWVIHTVGPRFSDPDAEWLLKSAYTSALARADEVGARTVAFPSISTGVYGYPGSLAAGLSVEALLTAQTAVEECFLVAYSPGMAELWESALHGRPQGAPTSTSPNPPPSYR